MASQNHPLRAAQLAEASTRNSNTDLRPYQQHLKFAVFDITLGAAVASNDDIILGSLGVAGKVIPEHSRICGISGGAVGVFTLEKVNPAGTVAAVTGAATTATDGVPVAFARTATSLVYTSFNEDDYLQLTFTEASAGAIVATDVLQLSIAYVAEETV
jgi:hypothetical protein